MPRNVHEYEPIDGTYQQILDVNIEDTYCNLYGYETTRTRSFFYHFFGIIFLGVPYLLSSWFISFKTIKYKKKELKDAKIVLVKDGYGNYEFIKIRSENIRIPNVGHVLLRLFSYRHNNYVWINQQEAFASLECLIPHRNIDHLLNDTEGLFYHDYIDLLKIYGPNKIEIKVKSYWRLFKEEVFNPFYVFQVVSMILWSLDDYLIYAGVVLLLTVFSIITALREMRKQSEALHDLVESSKSENVKIIRRDYLCDNNLQDAKAAELVPGDLIVLPKSNFVIPCDAVLLTGQCIVNESMLTGESVPIVKTSLHSANEIYSPSTHKRHTLFAGTYMIQSRYYGGEDVLARVVATGFNTTKGALVKSILYPTPAGIQFYKDSLKFILVLFLIASIGMGYSTYMYIIRKASIKKIILRSLDIVTIVVPPALPAAMTVGIVYSQNRLKKLKIFCISPPKINVCGKIKLACFDKTGTLTNEGLDMHSVLPVNQSVFDEPLTESPCLDNQTRLVQAMAACHSITQIDGRLTGDPLDLSMFDFTQWYLEEPGEDETTRYDMLAPTIVRPHKPKKGEESGDGPQFSYQIGIIRQFPFSSTLQSMSVICRELNAPSMVAFTKGAPEKMARMCIPESLPTDYNNRLSQYAAQGFRVIALAYKELPVKFQWKHAQKAKREIIECELHFLGLLVMQNTLKPQTTPVIRLLHQAKIRTVMITGDNILTAISVARDCEMVKRHDDIYIVEIQDELNQPKMVIRNTNSTDQTDITINFDFSHCHFAIEGTTWTNIKTFFPDMLPQLLVRATIFARFQPDQKTQLVTYLQSLDYVVSMVGDGANDCGALKAAHVGVSLSQAEASVAAPFTSAIEDISCIVHLMLEGRCALVTSFAVFKYMALYSLIQFTSVLILYKQHSILGDGQFLFIDLIITTVLAITIGRQGPAFKLGERRPPGSLVVPTILLPIVIQVFICILVQIGSLYFLYQQDWFEPVSHNRREEIVVCWENTVIFTVSSFQYLILAFVYAKGYPYRQRLISNFWFLFCALALLCFQVFLAIAPSKTVAELFELMYLPERAAEQNHFRYMLLLLPVSHFLAAMFVEVGVADRLWFRRFTRWLTCKTMPKNMYKLLLHDNL